MTHPLMPHVPHVHIPHHHTPHVSNHAHMQAVRQSMAFQRKMQARAAASGRRAAAISQARDTAESKRQQMIASLHDCVSKPLDCVPCKHSGAAKSLLIASNWVDGKGVNRVVLSCNTLLPGSGRAAAVLLYSDDGVEWVDLIAEGINELTKRGRLFLYSANLQTPEGSAFAVLPAHFESEDGIAGHWGFATVGTYKRRPFVVDLSGCGTFVSLSQRTHMVARPTTFDVSNRCWLWCGRSSATEAEKRIVLVGSPFDREISPVRFLLPAASKTHEQLVALRCLLRDDSGDPLAVFDGRANKHLLIANHGKLMLICRPNSTTKSGRPIFLAQTSRASDGASVFAGSGEFNGEVVQFELEANDKDHRGRPTFVVPVNCRIMGKPCVAIALRDITPPEESGR